MLQSLKASGSVYFLELNISKPHIIAVILQSGIAGLIGCKLFHSCEFAVGDHLIPLFGSNLILENGLSILEMNNNASVGQKPSSIPISTGSGILRICRSQIIESFRIPSVRSSVISRGAPYMISHS